MVPTITEGTTGVDKGSSGGVERRTQVFRTWPRSPSLWTKVLNLRGQECNPTKEGAVSKSSSTSIHHRFPFFKLNLENPLVQPLRTHERSDLWNLSTSSNKEDPKWTVQSRSIYQLDSVSVFERTPRSQSPPLRDSSVVTLVPGSGIKIND